MYGLNLDKETSRILSVGELGDGISIYGGVKLESLPDIDDFYDYCYINGGFIYSPIEKDGNSVTTQSLDELKNSPSIDERVATLESKIDQLTEAINKLISK